MSEQKSNRGHNRKQTRRGGGRSGNISKKQYGNVRYPSEWIIQRDGFFPRAGAFENKTYDFVDAFHNLSVLTSAAAANTFACLTFTFNSLADYTYYQGVFDQYRVMGMECLFKPSQSTISASTYTGSVYTVVDYDDNNTITPTQALDYANCIQSSVGTTLVRSFVPHVADALYAGGVFTSFGNRTSPWIDTGSAGVVHFGLKIAIDPTSTAMNFDSTVRVWLQFRNVR